MQPIDRASLQERFLDFAQEAMGRSALYEQLSSRLAHHEVALDLLAQAPSSQRRPNLLFAAVHDLLLSGTSHPLARFYPSVARFGPDIAPDAALDVIPADGTADEVFASFTDLLQTSGDQLATTMRTRRTQTNEVGRCAALWPAVQHVAAEAHGPLTLVELGASAGLLLHLDRYDYDAAGAAAAPSIDAGGGRPAAPSIGAAAPAAPSIRAAIRGEPPLPARHSVHLDARIGIDLGPLDVTDPADARWLRACVWPEDLGRMERLDAAIAVARRHDDLDLREADAVDALGSLLASLPEETTPCLFHSATLAYLGADQRQAISEVISDAGRTRDLTWLSLEGRFIEPFASHAAHLPSDRDEEVFLLGLTRWTNGVRHDRLLARVQPHGVWIDWLSPAEGEIPDPDH